MGGGGRGGSPEKTRAVEERARAFHSDFLEAAAALARTAKMEAIVVDDELVRRAASKRSSQCRQQFLAANGSFGLLRPSPHASAFADCRLTSDWDTAGMWRLCGTLHRDLLPSQLWWSGPRKFSVVVRFYDLTAK